MIGADKLRVAVLISGTGSNLKALIEAAKQPECPFSVAQVVSNRPNAGGLAYAQAEGIPTSVIDHKNFESRDAFDGILDSVLQSSSPDIVALAGFMRILTSGFIDRWRGRIVNIHPSLLPLYKGLHPYQQALDDGALEHGCTVHWVTPGVDEGPIIAQRAIPVHIGDTAETLAARTLAEEHRLYAHALGMIARGEARFPAD